MVLGSDTSAAILGLFALTGLIASFHTIIYAYGRVLFSLSRAGYYPRWISRTSRWHTPHVALLLGTANREGPHSDSPHTIDLGARVTHLGFGGGIHRCLGSHLARREVTATATHNRQLGTVAATGNVELQRSEGRSLIGLGETLLEPLARKPGGSEWVVLFWLTALLGWITTSRRSLGWAMASVPLAAFALAGLRAGHE